MEEVHRKVKRQGPPHTECHRMVSIMQNLLDFQRENYNYHNSKCDFNIMFKVSEDQAGPRKMYGGN